MKKIYFDTMGCPKNTNDTEVGQGALLKAGYGIADSIEEADCVVVNTCGFIETAKETSINRIFEVAQCKEEDAKLLVSGCLSQRYTDELFEEMPEVDAFIGVNEYERLPEIVDRLFKNEERFKDAGKVREDCLHYAPRKFKDNPYSATIKIAEGCNNACTYCVIPQIRGRFRSKPEEDVIREARELAESGCRELILIAQDTACYGIDLYGEYRLAELLRKLCKVEGIQWIRILYCYEDKITDELIETMAEEKKICNYIDIPLQHASDNVLRGMKRKSSKESIIEILGKLRSAMPDIHIRTTILTGFPGETEEDYDELIEFIEEQKFERLGAFTYSQEEGTRAGVMSNQVPEEIKQERFEGIMLHQMDISLEKNREKIGKIMEVIVDEVDETGAYMGRTRYDAPEIDNGVIFTSHRKLVPGDIVMVNIKDAFDYDLVGEEVYE